MTRTLITLIGVAALVGVAATVDAQTAPPKPGTNVTVFGPQATAPPAPGTNPNAPGFVDANGDGICDWYQAGGAGARRGQGPRAGNGGRYGPGDGTGNQGVGPRDGTGYGAGARAGRGGQRGPGSPNCDGTGPKGPRGGRR